MGQIVSAFEYFEFFNCHRCQTFILYEIHCYLSTLFIIPTWRWDKCPRFWWHHCECIGPWLLPKSTLERLLLWSKWNTEWERLRHHSWNTGRGIWNSYILPYGLFPHGDFTLWAFFLWTFFPMDILLYGLFTDSPLTELYLVWFFVHPTKLIVLNC